MAKTSTKRKAEDGDNADVDDEDAPMDDAEGDDSSESEGEGSDDNDDGDDEDNAEGNDGGGDVVGGDNGDATRTPGPSAAGGGGKQKKTPGSSPGMAMRSGRRKKRPKRPKPSDAGVATGATPARKRVRRAGAGENGAAPARKNGEDEGAKEAPDCGRGKAPPPAAAPPAAAAAPAAASDETATARKVPPEATRRAVAAAQVSGATAPAAAAKEAPAANGGVNPLFRLVSQTLRLPSQKTPKPPTPRATTGATPGPPPGGRRLVFETAKKHDETGGNRLLIQTRQLPQRKRGGEGAEPGTTQSRHFVSREGGAANLPGVEPAVAPERALAFLDRCIPDALFPDKDEFKRDAALYFKGWILLLSLCFLLFNVANMGAGGGLTAAWNVRARGTRLVEWYGIRPPAIAEGDVAGRYEEEDEDGDSEDEDEDDEEEDEELEEELKEEPEDVVQTISEIDPELLASARAALRAHRANLRELRTTELASEALGPSELLLEEAFREWREEEGKAEARRAVREGITSADVVIFSQSRCPQSLVAKDLFRSMWTEADEDDNPDNDFDISAIELDLVPNGENMQLALLELTGQKIWPHIFVRGRHVGGKKEAQVAAREGHLEIMLGLDMKDLPSDDMKTQSEKVVEVNQAIAKKKDLLLEWEWALVSAEEAVGMLDEGAIEPLETNQAIAALSKVSMVPVEASMLDSTSIALPGEGCEGMDYTVPKPEEEAWAAKGEGDGEEEEIVEVVGGIDIDALDIAGDRPVRLEDARSAYESLLKLAQESADSLVSPSTGPSPHARRWAEHTVGEVFRKEEVDEVPKWLDELHTPLAMSVAASSASLPDGDTYTVLDAIRDTDRLLEIEDADRTGKFDHASVIHGAWVVRRGPFATSYSLYETLPLLNRALAYAKLRFYGHPPEAALLPEAPLHGRGGCWSFPDEYGSVQSRRRAELSDDGIRGEYATLTVSLPSDITVSEVVVEHPSPGATSDPSTAIQSFRVVGFEDSGAYGDPWELGTFTFKLGPTMQAFSIPTVLDGQNVPRLKAFSIAVDSNHGGSYSCLYRVRVHGA